MAVSNVSMCILAFFYQYGHNFYSQIHRLLFLTCSERRKKIVGKKICHNWVLNVQAQGQESDTLNDLPGWAANNPFENIVDNGENISYNFFSFFHNSVII